MELTIEKKPYSRGMDFVKITGLTDAELYELKSMENQQAKEALIDLLDRLNNGIGSSWARGNGIYGVWFDNEAAYLNIGNSCD